MNDAAQLAAACRAFADALASIGIDPARVTVVMDREDKRVLERATPAVYHRPLHRTHDGLVEIEDVRFSRWRQP